MRIAQIVSLDQPVPPRTQNGLEFVVSWLTEELVHRGHDVTLFAPENSRTSAHLKSLFPDRIRVLYDMPWRGVVNGIWNSIYAAASGEFDLIHAHDGNISYTAPFISIPIIQTIHEPYNDFWGTYTNASIGSEIPFIINTLKKIHYINISQDQQSEFKSKGKSFFEDSTVIHNGVPVERFEFNEKPDKYLFYIGYINKEKGADTAIKIAKATGHKLILAGGYYGQELFFKEHIEPYLGDQIRYVGPVDFDAKVKLYKNAYATLAPLTWREPFGLTLVESQACGTPVIAFDKGAAPELIAHGKTGFIVKTEEEMIQAIKKIPSIERKACRAWVEKNFSVSRMVDEYEKLYRGLTGKK